MTAATGRRAGHGAGQRAPGPPPSFRPGAAPADAGVSGRASGEGGPGTCRKPIRVAVFTDNDFAKVNGVTTTLSALLYDDLVRTFRRHVPGLHPAPRAPPVAARRPGRRRLSVDRRGPDARGRGRCISGPRFRASRAGVRRLAGIPAQSGGPRQRSRRTSSPLPGSPSTSPSR